MKKILLLLPLFLLILSVNAQERYKVLYDYQTENIQYFSLDRNNKIKDTLEKPKFKKNSQVELQVVNVNPFAVKLETDVSEEEIHKSGGSGFNFGTLLGGIGSMSQDNLKLNLGNLPVSDTLFSRGAQSRGAGLSSKFQDLNDIATNVSALKSTLMSNLKNPNLTKEEIEANLKQVAAQQQDVRLPNPDENFYNYLANLEKVLVTGTNEIITDVKMLKADLDRTSNEGVASRGELVLRNTSYTELDNLIQSVQNSTVESVASLNKIQSLYTALEGSVFSRTYDYYLDSDKSNIELTFKESDFAQDSDAGNNAVLKSRNIKILSRGGFKINTGVALTMNNFESTSEDYFITEDGQIASNTNDYFIPNLSTMINFYPIISENFNLGGSFGLSIPISDDVKGVNFLLGPSLFLGNDSRLSLSGGVAYGPVDRLTNGLEAGDSTSLNSLDGFTKTVYDIGYYFGVSFSIFNIN
ncbi:hypothetical protein [Salinimicrobium soli]|uniref:hypothetical protein n=1 Tax=Salinimicrobium soli TaxID=1254399 RepID=UPI003AAF87D7